MQSCSLITPEINIPAYIYIEKITLPTTNYATEGSNSSKITDAWVYIDNKLIGIYELPAKIPILDQGDHKLTIRAGIKVNGIAATRAYYPFYDLFEQNINLKPETTDTVKPAVRYYPSTGFFQWMEDFESGGISLMKYSTSDTIIEKTSNPQLVFEGSYSGIAHLDNTKKYLMSATINNYVLPVGNNPVFLEMNYKTNNKIGIGLYANGTQRIAVITLNRCDYWNKIYINLTPMVNSVTNVTNFKIFIEAYKEDDVDSPLLLFDNIKLLFN